jgi:hypothetical protein
VLVEITEIKEVKKLRTAKSSDKVNRDQKRRATFITMDKKNTEKSFKKINIRYEQK